MMREREQSGERLFVRKAAKFPRPVSAKESMQVRRVDCGKCMLSLWRAIFGRPQRRRRSDPRPEMEIEV
jgi:hypothetical protein